MLEVVIVVQGFVEVVVEDVAVALVGVLVEVVEVVAVVEVVVVILQYLSLCLGSC